MRAMNKDLARQLKPGDRVRVFDLWNRSTPTQQLPNPVEIKGVTRDAQSQTGVMLEVVTLKGETLRLDASWFETVLVNE